MSQMGSLATVSLLGAVDSLTGNSGGVVLPDAGGNINVVGGNNITTVGNSSPNTLTVNVSGTTNHAVQVGNASASLTSLAVGTNGQVLIGATGADPAFATLTSTGGTITFTPGANTLNLEATLSGLEAITYEARSAGGTLTKGQLVEISGFDGGAGVPLLSLSSANGFGPCHGMILTTLDTVTTGLVQITGLISGVDTSAFSNGELLYLSTVAGNYTNNPPDTESNAIYPLGSVVKSDATTGSILLNVPPISVLPPNLNNDNILVGNSSGNAVTATLGNGILTYNTSTTTFIGSTVTQNGVLYGGASNAVSSATVGTNGQVLLGATAAAPAFGTLTSTGGTITFTTGANSLNLDVSGGGGIVWTEVTGTSQAMAINNGYIANNAGLVTLTLPTTAAIGSIIRVTGKGAGGWRIAQNASQTIYFGLFNTTTGTLGRLDSTATRDTVELVCVTANNDWNVISSIGNITVT